MRAGMALRQKWAQEAERARRAADPVLAAQDAAEHAAMRARVRAHYRYGQLVKAAVARGELTYEQARAARAPAPAHLRPPLNT